MRAPHRRLLSLCFVLGASASFAVSMVTLSACPSSACPYPVTSDIKVDPQMPCVQTVVNSCLHPTVEFHNQCEEALYVPTDLGLFTFDVTGEPELEVRSKQNVIYELRRDKATSTSATKEDYVIPFRVGTKPATLTFSVLSDT